MTDITINRWKRYGKDRLYATGSDDAKLGHYDLVLNEFILADGTDHGAVEAAVRNWCIANGVALPTPTTGEATWPDSAPVASTAVPTTIGEEDFANNVPGQLTRLQAAEEWEREKRIGVPLAVLGKLAGAHTGERAWRVGAKGEEVVGTRLNKLRKHGWHVLHSIRVGEKSDIDHLVIGTPGVFLVNTKSHPKAKLFVNKYGIKVNGSRTEHIKQLRAEVTRASKLLTRATGFQVEVMGMVALYNGGLSQPELKHAGSPAGTLVVTSHNINNVLKRRDATLDPQMVESIYAVARRAATWQ